MFDAAFPSRKAASSLTPPADGIGNPRQHHYRITVDMLGHGVGEEGLQSISFFASTHNDILTAANSLRDRLNCSACHATKLAVGLSLLSEAMHAHRDPALFTEPMRQLLVSLNAVAPDVAV
jgi:hypothetical protein